MWKCKKCGNTTFDVCEEWFDVTPNIDGVTIDESNSTELSCSECGNSGSSFDTIARWEDEND